MVRIKKLKKHYNLKVEYIQFPLHPDIPDAGISIEKYLQGSGIDINEMKESLKLKFEKEELPYGSLDMIYNTRLAQELAKWADTRDADGKIHMNLYKAYFAENKNLSDLDVLISIAKNTGLPEAAAREVLEKRIFSELVERDWLISKKMKVTMVPTFIVGDRGIVGFQSYKTMEGLLKGKK